MFGDYLNNVKKVHPLIHNITNYVTVNDCANILLACGGSPIMADDPEEAADITSISDGLNINLGTLNSRTISSMRLAGQKACELGKPVVLDPVGAGASKLRTETAHRLLEEVRFTVIRGNLSEIKCLAAGEGGARGVDADWGDRITPERVDDLIDLARAFSIKTGAVIAITGAIDLVVSAAEAYCIYNGHPMMASVTGTGCQLSALTAAFVAANPGRAAAATSAAIAAMGLAGEQAYRRLTPEDGNASYRIYLIDAIYRLTAQELEQKARCELR